MGGNGPRGGARTAQGEPRRERGTGGGQRGLSAPAGSCPQARHGWRRDVRYFTGTYPHKLDAKGRVSLPVAYRNTLKSLDSDHVVLIPQYYSKDYHIGLSEKGHEAAIASIERNRELSMEERRAMLRPLVADALLLMPDDAGRIVLPRDMREALGLKGEVLFTALGPFFEIWNPATHAAREAADAPRADLMGVL